MKNIRGFIAVFIVTALMGLASVAGAQTTSQRVAGQLAEHTLGIPLDCELLGDPNAAPYGCLVMAGDLVEAMVLTDEAARLLGWEGQDEWEPSGNGAVQRVYRLGHLKYVYAAIWLDGNGTITLIMHTDEL